MRSVNKAVVQFLCHIMRIVRYIILFRNHRRVREQNYKGKKPKFRFGLPGESILKNKGI